ncbi:putative solute-binding protein [Agitococcus lubricus]|uniref:TRAP-type C4-dicarboxylate transport system substrate-binding protein n=1 Tax=Agitococcus lubricus TaxID=1077255 RepID=A0A2T5IYA4_9GAMM|nr:putative solute-binding protein [Agitococcus lubricus]PTQ88945.1 hypothetical protein C8N29_11094 [Agitococcus lubricus]
MFPSVKKLLSSLVLATSVLALAPAQAADLIPLAKEIKPNAKGLPPAFTKPLKVSICFLDMQGTSGEFYSRAKDLALIARRWNMIADFKVMANERQVVDSFKEGKCEAAVMPTLRAREFNLFMGSVDAIGAIPSYQHMRLLLKTLFDPKLEPLTITGPYQVVSIFPVGAQYLHVRDRTWETPKDLANKKASVLDWNVSLSQAMNKMGTQAVAADIGHYTAAFNKGETDMIVAPAVAYWPYELHTGLANNGGIYSTPVMQMTASLIINRDLLQKKTNDLDNRVAAFRSITSQFLDEMLDRLFLTINTAETQIPKKYWMILEPEHERQYQDALRQARIQLTQEGVYDAKMMKVLKKVRCKIEPNAAECTRSDE